MKYPHVREIAERELRMQQHLENQPLVLNIPLILGPVGIGKTSLARELSKLFDYPLVTINVGENSDAVDVAGMPSVSAPNDDFEGRRILDWVHNRVVSSAINGPVLLFLDDVDKASDQILAALLAILGNRTVRSDVLHPGTLIMAAGNRVDDDKLATELSESLLTRVTPVVLEPDLRSFSEYGLSSGDIHPSVIGFLQYKPEYLHTAANRLAGSYRLATPRGWWEVSQQMKAHPNPSEIYAGLPNWQQIVSLKCGEGVGADFWAWFEIIQKIDAKDMMKTGNITGVPSDPSEKRRWQFAATFAIASVLREGIDKEYYNIDKVFDILPAELRLATAVQLPMEIRSALAKTFPHAAQMLTAALFPGLSKARAQ